MHNRYQDIPEKVSVRKLDGAVLDALVALAMGLEPTINRKKCKILDSDSSPGSGAKWKNFSPSTNWGQGGPLIERERIALDPEFDGTGAWIATIGDLNTAWGTPPEAQAQTPLIAAMRAFVISRLGAYIQRHRLEMLTPPSSTPVGAIRRNT